MLQNIVICKENSFTRTFNNGNIFKYEKGEQVMFYPKQKPVAFLSSKSKDVKVNDYFITLDLETRTLFNGNLEVISGVIYTGTEFLTYFIIAYNNDSKKLIYAFNKRSIWICS